MGYWVLRVQLHPKQISVAAQQHVRHLRPSSSYRRRCGRRRGGWRVATYDFHRPNQHLFMHVIGGGRRDVSSLLRFPHALPLILPHATALTRTTAPSRQSPPLPHFPLLFFVTHLAIKAWPPHGVPSHTRLCHHLTAVMGRVIDISCYFMPTEEDGWLLMAIERDRIIDLNAHTLVEAAAHELSGHLERGVPLDVCGITGSTPRGSAAIASDNIAPTHMQSQGTCICRPG
jgi:hypothetical protein